jgi:membrane protease YdiL (CAAX protease family)
LKIVAGAVSTAYVQCPTTLLPSSLFWLAALLVSLAYLLGRVGADLMRLDQIVRRVLLHALTGLLLLAALLLEEIIFRGYGFDTLEEALGTPGAIAISVPLFALNHGPGWKRFVGFSMAGLLLAFLRLGTGNLWLAGGFHLAWNLVQQALFGPLDGPPSIRPLQLHGPPAGVGRPGRPDPGWLQILAFTLLAALAGVWLRQKRAAERSDGCATPSGVGIW